MNGIVDALRVEVLFDDDRPGRRRHAVCEYRGLSLDARPDCLRLDSFPADWIFASLLDFIACPRPNRLAELPSSQRIES